MGDKTHTPTEDTAGPGQRILLLTGLAGGGKTTALHALEDLGWEVIDNFPVRMLEGLISSSDAQMAPLAIGFDSRTRGFVPDEMIELLDRLSKEADVSISTLFIDCSNDELERRYNETRRRHPMAQDRPLLEGINAERELLEPLRNWAEMVLDTSAMSTSHLQQSMREIFGEKSGRPLTLSISSFGFARGMPPLADLVFDMRFLDNPHWVEELRDLTGMDEAVAAHIRADDAFAPAFTRIRDLLLDLIPRYQAQSKSYVHVAFGCTGGQHRSVFTAEQMARDLRKAGFSPTVRHRNLGSRNTDEIEGRGS
ncbi:MAG TPA: RNase adapter RapZ [Erythrobacter sp.]|nr:RNase adapter RapZ [Erythrobacter sp.]